MSDSTMLLAVFEDIEPAAKGIEKLHELGVNDDQMNVISGIPVKETILDRPSARTYVSRIGLFGALPGDGSGVIPHLWDSHFCILCMWAGSRYIPYPWG